MHICCKPGGLEDKDPKTESGFSHKIMQKHTKSGSLWRIRIRKLRFPKLILHRGLEAFVDICLILFFEGSGSETESRFSPKIMQIRCKLAGLEDQDPKTESRFSPKILQINCKQGGLEDKDPKTESGFSPKIMQICRKPGGLEDKGPKTESGFSLKIMQIRCTPGFLEDKDPKTESGFSSKIMQKQSKPGSLKDQDPISKISKINFASWIRSFCRHLSHFFFLEDQDPKIDISILNLMIGNISNIASWFRGRTFSDTCGARTFFHFQNSVGGRICMIKHVYSKMSMYIYWEVHSNSILSLLALKEPTNTPKLVCSSWWACLCVSNILLYIVGDILHWYPYDISLLYTYNTHTYIYI